jgi:hypothetical protein
MKFLLLVLLLLSTSAEACKSYTIGFRGRGGQFDQRAFEQYARRQTDCVKVFNHTEIDAAAKFINKINRPYELYGFSAGASSIKPVLKKAKRQPRYIITVGALYVTDVDFTRTEINFDNFFDDSGKGTRSPGIHVKGVSHSTIQQYVADFFKPM